MLIWGHILWPIPFCALCLHNFTLYWAKSKAFPNLKFLNCSDLNCKYTLSGRAGVWTLCHHYHRWIIRSFQLDLHFPWFKGMSCDSCPSCSPLLTETTTTAVCRAAIPQLRVHVLSVFLQLNNIKVFRIFAVSFTAVYARFIFVSYLLIPKIFTLVFTHVYCSGPDEVQSHIWFDVFTQYILHLQLLNKLVSSTANWVQLHQTAVWSLLCEVLYQH